MPLSYDREHTAQFFDAYAEREWQRHEDNWAARTSFAIHCHYLAGFVGPDDLVLDAGAGPGR
jgi:hypothetical protein